MHFYKCRVRHAAKLKRSGRCSELKCVNVQNNVQTILFNYPIIANAIITTSFNTSCFLFSVFLTFFFHLMHPAHHVADSAGGPREPLTVLTVLLVLVEPVPPGLASPAMTFWYFYLGLQAVLAQVHVYEHC